jgi:hypothetical protein
MAEAGGDAEVPGSTTRRAKAYVKAAEIDPESATGKEAAARAAELAE